MSELKSLGTGIKSATGISERLVAYSLKYRAWSKSDRWALIIVICVFIVLAVFDSYAHQVVAPFSVESDDYFIRADELLAGKPYADPYRPPLYVFVTAGLSLILNRNTFLSGSFVSSLATCLAIGLTYLLAKRFVQPKYALLAELLVAVNSLVITHGLWVSTDALFTTVSLALLLTAVVGLPTWSGRAVKGPITIGVLFGLAYLTRYTAIFLLPMVIYGLWQTHGTRRQKLQRLGFALASATVVTLPWLTYNTYLTGSPLANSNWQNFAFAAYGNGDWRYFDDASRRFSGYLDVMLYDFSAILRLWLKNLGDILYGIPMMHSGSPLLAFFLPIGFFSLVRSQIGRLLLLYALACIAPVLFTFFYMPRLLLPATPVFIIIGVIGFAQLEHWFASRRPIWTVMSRTVVAASILTSVFLLVLSLIAAVLAQPVADVRMIDRLMDELPKAPSRPVRVLSTYPYLGYFSEHRGAFQHYALPTYADKLYKTKEFANLLMNLASSHQVDYLLISDRTTFGGLSAGMVDEALANCWALIRQESGGGVRLYQRTCAW